mmetsp:Transcript_3671/g.8418  ORF Transcript_3671/g.8418 Transcript_3671/m.8418 type:complete len:200 (+) Transcript_3671:768-1367(+)
MACCRCCSSKSSALRLASARRCWRFGAFSLSLPARFRRSVRGCSDGSGMRWTPVAATMASRFSLFLSFFSFSRSFISRLFRMISSFSTALKACGLSWYGFLQAGQRLFKFSLMWCQHHMQTCVSRGEFVSVGRCSLALSRGRVDDSLGASGGALSSPGARPGARRASRCSCRPRRARARRPEHKLVRQLFSRRTPRLAW